MANRKILNANPYSHNGINFKSSVEFKIYKILLSLGIKPDYEVNTFILSPRVRATVPFYNRTKERGFHLITEPISQITYTPDFTFVHNGVFVIIEVKGFENDVFPVKRNLFRKYLEDNSASYPVPVMYFEIRNKKELLEAIKTVEMETPVLYNIRKLIPCLPDRDIPTGTRYLSERNFSDLQSLVDSVIAKVKKSKGRKASAEQRKRYENIDIASLQKLSLLITEYKNLSEV